MMDRRRATRAHIAVAAIDTAPAFSFRGLFIGKVVSVYDGDTCRIAFEIPRIASMPARIVTYPVRTLLYDAPEKKGDSLEYGLEVREILVRLVLGRTVALYVPDKLADPHFAPTGKGDPYRRMLGHLFVATPHVRQTRWWDCLVCGGATQLATTTASPVKKPERKRRGRFAVTARDEKDGSATVEVRGKEVRVPATADIPRGFRNIAEAHVNGATLPGFIHVNDWMLKHARVKSCKGSRDGYSAAELRDGVDHVPPH